MIGHNFKPKIFKHEREIATEALLIRLQMNPAANNFVPLKRKTMATLQLPP